MIIQLHAPGCVVTGLALPDPAHAHVRGEYRGWICLADPALAADTPLVLHEVAHLLAGHRGHTRTWMRIYAELGGPALRSVRDPATMTRFSR